jgi:hypothetical protein
VLAGMSNDTNIELILFVESLSWSPRPQKRDLGHAGWWLKRNVQLVLDDGGEGVGFEAGTAD